MRFHLVDRITDVQAGKSLQATKNLTLGEEYLADHFPTFPVMPGVLMLQALVEAGAWLVRATEDFRHSVVVLREARGVKYGAFMEPGRRMTIHMEWVAQDAGTTTLKGKGESDGQTTVTAKLTLARYNLRDRDPALQALDEELVRDFRAQYALLRGGGAGL